MIFYLDHKIFARCLLNIFPISVDVLQICEEKKCISCRSFPNCHSCPSCYILLLLSTKIDSTNLSQFIRIYSLYHLTEIRSEELFALFEALMGKNSKSNQFRCIGIQNFVCSSSCDWLLNLR